MSLETSQRYAVVLDEFIRFLRRNTMGDRASVLLDNSFMLAAVALRKSMT